MITYLHHHHRDLVQESSFLSEPLSFEPVALCPVESFPQSFHVDIEPTNEAPTANVSV